MKSPDNTISSGLYMAVLNSCPAVATDMFGALYTQISVDAFGTLFTSIVIVKLNHSLTYLEEMSNQLQKLKTHILIVSLRLY